MRVSRSDELAVERESLPYTLGAASPRYRSPMRIDNPGRRTVMLGLAALGSAAALPASATSRGRAAPGGPIIVSGAAGHLGELTIRALIARGVPASRLILVSRTPD